MVAKRDRTMAAQLPDPRGPVAARGQSERLREVECGGRTVRPVDRLELRSGSRIPDTGGAILGIGQHIRAGGTEARPAHRALMSGKQRLEVPVRRLPDAGCSIAARCHDVEAVRAKRDVVDEVRVANESGDETTTGDGIRVPDCGYAVEARSGDVSTVRAHCDIDDLPLMTLELVREVEGRKRPDSTEPVRCPGGESLSARGERRAQDPG